MNSNYGLREEVIEKLLEFLNFALDANPDDNIKTIIEADEYATFVECITDMLARCCPPSIKNTFKFLITSLEQNPEFDISDFEADIHMLIAEIERCKYNASHQYLDGSIVLDSEGTTLETFLDDQAFHLRVVSNPTPNNQQEQKDMKKDSPITLEITAPEYAGYSGGQHGFHLYATIINKTNQPLRLQLVECSIFSNHRKHIPDFNYSGYAFSEEYIFPNDAQTFGKIWITDDWPIKTLSPDTDYITIKFKASKAKKLFYFKHELREPAENQSEWEFVDYYVIDL